LLVISAPINAEVLVSPNDPGILYMGRWDNSDVLQPWAHWKGSSITLRFEGTSLAATFSATNTDYLRVIIDDDVDRSAKIPVSSSTRTYLLATGLPGSVHKIEIIKETDVGRWTFHGFELDDDSSLAPPPARPAYKISFYGDSNLAGYSLESEQNESGQHLRGSYYGYAGIVARMFGAEYENISRSGATIRSLNGFYDRIDYWYQTPQWHFADFQADLVVANIGANDVGRPKKRIKSQYHDLLDDLRLAYPDAHIMLYNAWGWDYDEPANYIHEVIAERGDANMSSATFPWIFEQWHGCEYDHAGMAQVLADHVTAMLGWPQGARDVMSGLGINGDVANGSFEELAPFGGYGWRYYTDAGVSRVHDSAGAQDGAHYLRLEDGAASHQPFPARGGDSMTVTAWMRAANDAEQVEIRLDSRDQEMWTTPLQVDTVVHNLTTSWQKYSLTTTAATGTPRPVFHGRVTFTAGAGATVDIDNVELSVTGGATDTASPAPDPMTWADAPVASSDTAITMTATTASDPSGVEYYFACVSGPCNDSGWQEGTSYSDSGLSASTAYGYRVRARDKSANQNPTEWSATGNATTQGSCTATQMYIQSIVLSTVSGRSGNKRGRATVTVVDNCAVPVAGVTVSGTFSGDYAELGSSPSDGSGIATIETTGTQKGKVSFGFCIDNVWGGTLSYNGSLNLETCDSL
jgi:hypothetical protein